MKGRRTNKNVNQPRGQYVALRVKAVATQQAKGTLTGTKMMVANKEYVGAISLPAGAGFQIFNPTELTPGYDIIPTSSILFPWLSKIARNYEKYRFTRLSLILTPMAPTTASGKVYAMIDYDYDDDIPADIMTFMQNKTTKSCGVWEGLKLNVDIPSLDMVMKWRYTEAGKPGAEARTMFGGYIVLAACGLGQTTTFDVHVDYNVELDIPCPGEALDLAAVNPASATFTQEVVASAPPLGLNVAYPIFSPVPVTAPFRLVNPSALGLAMFLHGTLVPQAIELLSSRGVLGAAAYLKNGTKTPIDFLTGKGCMDFAGFSSLGNMLFDSAYTVVNGSEVAPINVCAGCDGGYNPASAESPATVNSDFNINVLKRAYAALKYIVPFVRSTEVNYPLAVGSAGFAQKRLIW